MNDAILGAIHRINPTRFKVGGGGGHGFGLVLVQHDTFVAAEFSTKGGLYHGCR